MALTVAQIIQVSKHAVLYEMQRMNYVISDPSTSNGELFYVRVSDPTSGKSVPGVWSKPENEEGSEGSRTRLASQLLKNMVNSLDFMLENRE